ncbi:acyltransferase domain-containing protein [Streptomyces sp. LaBMicrA B280]|uniref:acyltransferase domain-containing protein n=1 Tax=Streptomyces sp. LaBMicrA B280 TaxID=3391001 RepID=UPI003BA70BCB
MLADGRKGRTAFLFSAGASPRPGTGRELAAAFPLFAKTLDELCARLDPYLELPLKCVMFATPGTRTATLLGRSSYAGPALFALQVAQYRLLRSWGARPDVLFGHGAGRMAAAYAAGVFSLADGCHAVGTLARLLDGALGEAAPQALLTAYGRTLATLHPCPPRLPLVSDVTARPVGVETAEPGFWLPGPGTRRFADVAALLHRDGVRTWLELGPADTLTRALAEDLPPGAAPAPGSAYAVARDWAELDTGGGTRLRGAPA